MKLKKLLPVLLLVLVLIYAFLPDAGSEEINLNPAQSVSSAVESVVAVLPPAPADEAAQEKVEEPQALLDPEGYYYSKEEVALYIYTYGCLPPNFVTKAEAEDAGWSEGSVEKYISGAAIGGNRFGNREGLLPKEKGRKYYECDVNYEGGYRGGERIVYSSDGLIFYTGDHYESFEQLYE